MEELELKQMIEAVLFAAGHPMTYDKLGELVEMTPAKMRDFVREFSKEYNCNDCRGIMLLALGDCCQLCTKEEFLPYIKTALGIKRGGNLSNSSIETLAIIAYNQPVTRLYIDTVRGVDSSYAVTSLLDRDLIEARGRLDAPGRPMLYGTTPAFLRSFGLSSLSDLPDGTDGGFAALGVENLTIDDIANESDTPPSERA